MKLMIMYKETLSDILVFKTNVSSQDEALKIGVMLSVEKKISKWNFDLDDVDKILRIECEHLNPLAITELLRSIGFMCEELE